MFGTGIITARALGPENLGYVKFILLTVYTLGQFGSLGIIDATCYFQKKSKYDLETIFRVNLTYLFIASLIYLSIMFLIRASGAAFTDYPFSIYLYAVSFIILFGFINDLLFATLVSKEKIIALNNIDLLLGIINLIILYFLSALGKLNSTTYLILIPSGSALRFFLMWRIANVKPAFQLSSAILREEFVYGFKVFLGALFIYLNYRMDQWFIRFYHGNKELGLYSVGVSLAEIILIVPLSIINPMRARLYNINNDALEFKRITAKTIKFALYATALLSLMVVLFVPLISSEYLYGPKFTNSVRITQILVAGIVFLTFGKIGSHYYNVKGRPIIPMLTSFTIFSINLILNILLIPKFGIKGAAYASSFSYFIYGMIFIYLYLKIEKFNFNDLFIIKKEEILFYISKFTESFAKNKERKK